LSKEPNIEEAIVQSYSELSPNARIIANYIQQNPLAIISMSVSGIANVTQTSKATVSRFFRQIGYESHQQAKAQLVARRVGGFPVANTNLHSQNQLNNEIANITQTLNGVDASQLKDIVNLLSNDNKISIIGYRNSYPIALHLRQQLMQIRSSVRILPQPGQTLAEELVSLDQDEVIILIGFRRRPKNFDKLVDSVSKQPVILITDPTGQVFNKQVNHLLVCYLGQENAFDSYAAPMSMVSILCNETYKRLANKGQVRTTAISKMYQQLDELSEL
jgi:DNA-binding MurR/RpiR family transcriptional regulator